MTIFSCSLLLLSDCKKREPTYENMIEFLLDAENNILSEFQIIPVVAIYKPSDIRSLPINRKGEILLGNEIISISELKRKICPQDEDKIICFRGSRFEDYAQMTPEYIIEVLRVLKSHGIKRVCFGNPDVYRNLIVDIVNRPWNVLVEEIPRCKDSFDSTITKSSNQKPDLIIEEIKEIYDEKNNKQFRLKIKNIGTADFAGPIWVELTHTKSDILAGHYSEGQRVNHDRKIIEINKTTFFNITPNRDYYYDIIRFRLDVHRYDIEETSYCNNCFDYHS